MGWRFRKSVRLAPGLRVNLNKGTPSLSVGRRRGGLTLNLSEKGKRFTVGLPGTGLSYNTYSRHQGGLTFWRFAMFFFGIIALLVLLARWLG